jgi:purine-nucleoside phosphorylase
MYEGHDATLAALPARVLAALGAPVLFVSNAAGGIRRTFRPGDLMVIADHVNLTGRNPLFGPDETEDLRFPDMSDPYDAELRAGLLGRGNGRASRSWRRVRVGVRPSHETPAEVRTFGAWARLIGMSPYRKPRGAGDGNARRRRELCPIWRADHERPVNHEKSSRLRGGRRPLRDRRW